MLASIFIVFSLRIFADETQVMDGLYEAAEQIDEVEGFSSDVFETGEILTSMLSPREIMERIFGVSEDVLPRVLSLLAVLLGLLALCAVCNSLGSSMSGASEGFGFLSAAAVTSLIVGVQMELIFDVERFFERLGALMSSMIPITGVVWAMGGNVSTAAAGTLTLGIMLGFVERFCTITVVPVSCVCIVAAISAGLSGGGVLEGFSSGVKKVYGFFLGLVMTVFVFCLGAQTSIATAADTLTARGARVLAGTLIPGVGGAIGDTLRAVAGSAGYVKSVVGIGGIFLVLALTLPILTALLLVRGVILVAATAADMLDCKRENKLLSEIGNVYGMLIGAVSICAVAFIVALGLFVKCSVAVG